MTTPDGSSGNMMRVSTIAKFFDVEPATVRKWLNQYKDGDKNGLKGFQFNNQWRAYESDVVAFANSKFGEK